MMVNVPEAAPGELTQRLASLLTEFLDAFRCAGTDIAVAREEYAHDVVAAEKALADFDDWAGGEEVPDD